ncbi:MAG: class I SAM-dependent methyltransferase [Ignavibacteriae bacterium]|nr:class I SAM-dependent methyltransferase [Ignavibacteriota bacterium]
MKRSWKKLLLKGLNPLDYSARVLNNKTHLPPLDLRWDVGPLSNFESSAAEFRLYLKLLADLTPSSRVLDIGCGCGQIALELLDQLDKNGRYTGCDINLAAITWCRKFIASTDDRFSFFHLDVRNGMYNPHGRHLASSYRFDLNDQFDVILLKSVFTHMMKDEVENYVSQLSALLNTRGRCVATFFLLNDRQRALAEAGKNVIAFHRHDDTIAFANPQAPESIVAFDEDKLLKMASARGLELARPIQYGAWSGDKNGLSHQDILILQKRS